MQLLVTRQSLVTCIGRLCPHRRSRGRASRNRFPGRQAWEPVNRGVHVLIGNWTIGCWNSCSSRVKMGKFSQAGFLMSRAVADNYAVISSVNTIAKADIFLE